MWYTEKGDYMTPIRIGILGAGQIAAKLARTITGMRGQNAALYAIASRSEQKAKAFAKEFCIPVAYTGYDALLEDPAVDLVYIATPHVFHFEQTIAALQTGKHVLCEKPLAVNASQAEKMIALAKEKGLFLMEAMWTRFLPIVSTAQEWLRTGQIGRPHMLYATFGGDMLSSERIREPSLAGGALLDIGIYTLTVTELLFGTGMELDWTTAFLTPQGVDARSDSLYRYPDGKTAHLVSAIDTVMEPQITVYGSQGYLKIDGISNWSRMTLFGKGTSKTVNAPKQITGYEYEVKAACESIRSGRTECVQMPHVASLSILRQMDELRARWGVVYPFEK